MRSVLPRPICAYTTLYAIESNPSNCVVIVRLSGNDEPYPAAEPRGLRLATSYAARSTVRSSASDSA